MITENLPEKSSSYFSYLIRPASPCILGTEVYKEKSTDDDEFFLTAGGIIHSCPNIYELSIEHELKDRKLQSCTHLWLITPQTTASMKDNLNTYDTDISRYSIIPRFQPHLSSFSNDSINSEIELYQQRHANGLSQNHANSSSTVPTTWKSDNYLLLMPYVNHGEQASSIMNSNQRSRSFEQRISSIFT